MTGAPADRHADGVPPAEETLGAALEREHREIDGGIEDFVAGRGGTGPATARLRGSFAALRRHIYLEETFLFPPLQQGGLMAPVFVMLSEHRELWRAMDELETRLSDGTPMAELRNAATTLLAQLDRHNSKEEPIIYPHADVDLTEDQRAELRDFIAHEELPPGWTCAGL